MCISLVVCWFSSSVLLGFVSSVYVQEHWLLRPMVDNSKLFAFLVFTKISEVVGVV